MGSIGFGAKGGGGLDEVAAAVDLGQRQERQRRAEHPRIAERDHDDGAGGAGVEGGHGVGVGDEGVGVGRAALLLINISRTLLFWVAFILTRPLGAVVGDFLDKTLSAGGLALSRYGASAALFAFILTSLLLFEQKAARTAH